MGDANLVDANWIGTRADGTVPEVNVRIKCLRSFMFEPLNWYGGWGIRVSQDRNVITNNLIAGLHQTQSSVDTPPMAIEVFGTNHVISGNQIGVDVNGIVRADDGVIQVPGVCGGGIKAGGTGNQIVANTIVESKIFFPIDEGNLGGAILISDSSPLFGQLTLQENVAINGPGLTIEFGPSIPASLREFPTPVITNITADPITESTTITGNAGLCEACRIDFYLDDLDAGPVSGVDANQESLGWIGSVEVNVLPGENTDFRVEIAGLIPEGLGVRTNATTLFSGIIGSFGTGTSTALSEALYFPQP